MACAKQGNDAKSSARQRKSEMAVQGRSENIVGIINVSKRRQLSYNIFDILLELRIPVCFSKLVFLCFLLDGICLSIPLCTFPIA
jgi:hypothetical protein